MKKLISFAIVCAIAFSLTACGDSSASNATEGSMVEETSAIPDLTGEWTQVNSTSEDMYQYAIIADDTIDIYWVYNNDDTKALYWSGSFIAPTTADEPYTWDSVNDHDITDTALMASGDDMKTFTYEDGQISYEGSILGTTSTYRLEKTADLNDMDVEEAEDSEGTVIENAEDAIVATVEPSEEAIKAAQDYLEEHPNFRERGDLIASLEMDGYSTEEASAAAENCGADWYDLCVDRVEYWLSGSLGLTYDDLIEQLEWEEFTADEIDYAIDTYDPDWYDQAVIMANNYISNDEEQSRDRDNIIEVLKISGFTDAQAEYGADHCDGYWNQ